MSGFRVDSYPYSRQVQFGITYTFYLEYCLLIKGVILVIFSKKPRIWRKYGSNWVDIKKNWVVFFHGAPPGRSVVRGACFFEKADEFLSVGDEENHGYLIFSD